MTTDIIELNDFIVLIEQSNTDKAFVQQCEIDGDAVGFAFYGSGNVELEIKHNEQTKYLMNTTGLAIFPLKRKKQRRPESGIFETLCFLRNTLSIVRG